MGNHDKPDRRWTCFELWGGNRRVAEQVELPGLVGWIQSTPLEPATEGGDVHYVSVCEGGKISRIAVADVAGHGDSASAVAERLRDALQRHTDNWDQSALMRELNDAFLEGATGFQYATAVVLGFYRQTGELVFSNAGHLPPFWYRAEEQKWNVLEAGTPHARAIEGLPLGVIPGTHYAQTAVALGLNDLVVLYTDGLTEARDDTGEMLGQERLLALARECPAESPAALACGLLDRLITFRGHSPPGDDETLVVLQRVSV
jgi:sigma-B regulation protein RsbU (phosphoserine phosphatase)